MDLRIESMAPGGQGFSRHDGIAVFVDGGVPGDLVNVEVYDVHHNFVCARILNVIEPSPVRKKPDCKLFNVCGGCQWQQVAYEAQLLYKKEIIRQSVQHIAGLDPEIVLPAIASPDTLHYRNKVQYPVRSPENSRRILAGYYKENSHELINIKHCPVQPELLDRVMESSKSAAERARLSAYDEKKHSGLLRHIIARHSNHQNRVLLTIVLNEKPDSYEQIRTLLDQFAEELMSGLKEIAGVCVNFNHLRGNRILGTETRLIKGDALIIEMLASRLEHAPEKLQNGLQFQLAAASFFQINYEQAIQLMDLVLEEVRVYKEENYPNGVPLILDAYAGVGGFAMWVSSLAERVIAIEEVPDAIENARVNLLLNAIENVQPICGSVEAVLPELLKEGLHPQIVILDPPRKGADRQMLQSMEKLAPERIFYVSCNPATLARDLKILGEAGYRTCKIRPVDLFPQTFHVESVSFLERSH